MNYIFESLLIMEEGRVIDSFLYPVSSYEKGIEMMENEMRREKNTIFRTCESVTFRKEKDKMVLKGLDPNCVDFLWMGKVHTLK